MKIKKMIAALLSAAMVVTMMPATAMATDVESAVNSESVVEDITATTEDVAEDTTVTTEDVAEDTTATTEDVVDDMTATTEDDDSPVYLDGELTGSDGVYSVTVTFDTDAQIPEGATVSVKELSESDEAYQEAIEQVGPEEEEQFAALDISILDADGNEIEPASAVRVEIEVSGLEGVSEDTAVTVSHINESTGSPVVEAVADTADATDGVVSFTDEATVKAAFTVDSFSTFTITWNNNTYTSTGDTGVDVTDLDEDVIGQITYASDSSVGTSATVTASKTAVLNDDGTYDLTLSITGEQGSIENPAKVDLLLVVDKSGSMAYKMNGNSGDSRERMEAVVNAVDSLTDVLESNDKVDVQYNLITFSSLGYTSSDRDTGWTTDADRVNSAVSYFTETESNWWWGTYFAHDLEGGTNYEYAFYKANDALNSSNVRSDAQQIVIFLTDGIPTHRGITEESQDNNNRNYANTNAAIDRLDSMNADAFYAIGIGPSFTSTTSNDGTTNGRTNLTKIVNAAKEAKMTSQLYTTTSSSDLENIFKAIAGSTTFFAAEDVTITDPLSEYADLVLDASDNAQFTITVTNGTSTWTSEEGNETLTFLNTSGGDVTVTASYNSSDKTITLDFPDDYELEEGYTYSISTVITASEAAVTAGADGYNGTGETGTGTHAGEKGFYSNGDAEVTYTANGEAGSAEFPKPVIQLQYFYVYHSSVQGGNISKIAIVSLEDGTYDITTELSNGYLYGGYYSDYKGKGNYDDDGVEVDNDADSYAYAGDQTSWKKANAFPADGTKLVPVAGETYYLKEVPDTYLQPYLHVVYDKYNDNELVQMYLMTGVDDLNYQDIGLVVKDIDLNATRKTVVSFVIQEVNGTNTTLSTSSIWNISGFLAVWDQTKDLGENKVFSYQPYFVTPDGVTTYGTTYRYVNTQDNYYDEDYGFAKNDANNGIYFVGTEGKLSN